MSTTTGEDPKVLANYRFARGAVIILSVLIVIALIALLLGFTVRGGGKPAATASSGELQRVTLPEGSHIVSMDVEQGRLILRTRAFDGEEVDIIDTQDGHLVGRVSVPLASGEKPPR
jgi:hypothetical protein